MDLERITPRPRKQLPDKYRLVLSAEEVSECHDPRRAAKLGVQAGILCVQSEVKPTDTVVSPLYSEGVNTDSVFDFLGGMTVARQLAETIRTTSPEIVQEALLAVTSMTSTKQGVNV